MNEEMKQKIEEEALIRFPEDLIGTSSSYYDGNEVNRCFFIDGAEYRDSLANQWISVEDKLPEADIEVLCSFIGWDDNIFYGVFSWCKTDNEWTDWDGVPFKSVTHWMPLPQIPKEK